jgi:hypothetical protein
MVTAPMRMPIVITPPTAGLAVGAAAKQQVKKAAAPGGAAAPGTTTTQQRKTAAQRQAEVDAMTPEEREIRRLRAEKVARTRAQRSCKE